MSVINLNLDNMLSDVTETEFNLSNLLIDSDSEGGGKKGKKKNKNKSSGSVLPQLSCNTVNSFGQGLELADLEADLKEANIEDATEKITEIFKESKKLCTDEINQYNNLVAEANKVATAVDKNNKNIIAQIDLKKQQTKQDLDALALKKKQLSDEKFKGQPAPDTSEPAEQGGGMYHNGRSYKVEYN